MYKILIEIFSLTETYSGKRWTKNEEELIEKIFHVNPYPETEELHQLAKSLNISQKRVQNWFSYRRFKEPTEEVLLQSE